MRFVTAERLVMKVQGGTAVLKNMSLTEVQDVFAALDLTPIERCVEEIENAKDRLLGNSSPISEPLAYRVVLTNGTSNRSRELIAHAELERRSR